VDVILQVIGGVYTIGPEGALKIIEQLKPKIVVPMHFWYQAGLLEILGQDPGRGFWTRTPLR
jgi:L-ascorbate metabolism protein UlaG (beta-lactamase superfamily)